MRHPFLRTLAGASAVATDPNFENVTLLLHGDGTNGGQNNTFVDGSTNAFSITRNGNTTQGTFSPYGDNWSNFFDGTGDRIKFPDSADWDFGTGDFTIEFWFALNVVPTTDTATRQSFVSHYAVTTPRTGWNCQLGEAPDNKINFGWGDTALAVSAARTWSTNRWYHYAVARSGTSLKLFIDGTQVASVTDSTNMTGSPNTCTIGALNVGTPPGENFIQHVNGYVSNVRILKGTALYTAAFTPPTAPLTAITNTVLLTCQSNRFKDNSSSNRTATRDGDVSVQRFSPFSPTAAYAAGTIGGSGFFDGTGDFLRATASSLSSSSFTIECWIYYTGATNVQRTIYDFAAAANGYGMFAYHSTGGNIVVEFFSSNATPNFGSISSSFSGKYNSWVHIAVTYDGSTYRMFFDGTSVGTPVSSATNVVALNSLTVAARSDTTATQVWQGYISNFRYVTGAALYTSTFTPATAPLGVAGSGTTQLLLNFTNASILDNAMMAVPETVGNAQIDTTTKKYGTGSMEFDGTGDWLLIPRTPDLSFGTGDFTIEGWINVPSTNATYRCILSIGYPVQIYAVNGTIEAYFGDLDSAFYFVNPASGPASSITADTWAHFAVVRNGTTFTVYVNGTGGTAVTGKTQSVLFSSTRPAIGVFAPTSALPFTGYIDDLRITKGVARYTANFTAPTAAFPDL